MTYVLSTQIQLNCNLQLPISPKINVLKIKILANQKQVHKTVLKITLILLYIASSQGTTLRVYSMKLKQALFSLFFCLPHISPPPPPPPMYTLGVHGCSMLLGTEDGQQGDRSKGCNIIAGRILACIIYLFNFFLLSW